MYKHSTLISSKCILQISFCKPQNFWPWPLVFHDQAFSENYCPGLTKNSFTFNKKTKKQYYKFMYANLNNCKTSLRKANLGFYYFVQKMGGKLSKTEVVIKEKMSVESQPTIIDLSMEREFSLSSISIKGSMADGNCWASIVFSLLSRVRIVPFN